MRKVILNRKIEETRELSHVDDSKYYGLLISGGQKAFLVQMDFQKGKYRWLSATNGGLTHGNHYDGYENEFFSLAVGKPIEAGNQVFEFDRPEQLFQWLGKGIEL